MGSKKKILTIVSDDYGELGHAMYFCRGLNSEIFNCQMLVPGHRLGILSNNMTCTIDGYSTSEDIITVIDRFTPGLVVMFSGYLISTRNRLSFLKVARLVKEVRRRGIPMATSDPFMGQQKNFSNMNFATVLPPMSQVNPLNWPVFREWALRRRFCYLCDVFSGVTHLYPAEPREIGQTRQDSIGYFNPDLEGDKGRSNGNHWVFILSEVDYLVQTSSLGRINFSSQFANRLRESLELGKSITVIAPSELTDELKNYNLGEKLSLHSQLMFDDYQISIRDAQYVFYWNFFSFSVLSRMVNQKPVFFFDEGHMVKIMPSLLKLGLVLFYGGWRPQLLDISLPVDKDKLQQLESECRSAFKRAHLSLLPLQNSEAVVNRLMNH